MAFAFPVAAKGKNGPPAVLKEPTALNIKTALKVIERYEADLAGGAKNLNETEVAGKVISHVQNAEKALNAYVKGKKVSKTEDRWLKGIRTLLNWSQSTLKKNKMVMRATVTGYLSEAISHLLMSRQK